MLFVHISTYLRNIINFFLEKDGEGGLLNVQPLHMPSYPLLACEQAHSHTKTSFEKTTVFTALASKP